MGSRCNTVGLELPQEFTDGSDESGLVICCVCLSKGVQRLLGDLDDIAWFEFETTGYTVSAQGDGSLARCANVFGQDPLVLDPTVFVRETEEWTGEIDLLYFVHSAIASFWFSLNMKKHHLSMALLTKTKIYGTILINKDTFC